MKTEAEKGGMQPRARGCSETQMLEGTRNISSKVNAIEDLKMKLLKVLPWKLMIQDMSPKLNFNNFFKKNKEERIIVGKKKSTA